MHQARLIKLRDNMVALFVTLLLFSCDMAVAQGLWAGAVLKSESFDRDPGWDAFNNHVQPRRTQTVTQDFGYVTSKESGGPGAIGGKVIRSSKPCYYAVDIGTKTLNDKLSASGNFRLSASTG